MQGANIGNAGPAQREARNPGEEEGHAGPGTHHMHIKGGAGVWGLGSGRATSFAPEGVEDYDL